MGTIAVTFVGRGESFMPPRVSIAASKTYVLVGETVHIHGEFRADTANGDSLIGSRIAMESSPTTPKTLFAGDAYSSAANYSAATSIDKDFSTSVVGSYTFYAYDRSYLYPIPWSDNPMTDRGNHVTVEVGTSFPPPTVTITADPDSGDAPLRTTITWSSTYCNAVTVSGPGLSSTDLSGSQKIILGPGTHIYTITGTGQPSGTTISASTTVRVTDPNCELTTSVNPSGAGVVTGGGIYRKSSMATITETPNASYSFDHWSGNATGSSHSIQLLMDVDKSVVANFTLKKTQTITFPNPGQRDARIPFHLGATASSGLPVSYVIVTGSATLTPPDVLTPTAQGPITVRAMQNGDDIWAAANPVDVTFAVMPQAKVFFREEGYETTMQSGKVHSTTNFIDAEPDP